MPTFAVVAVDHPPHAMPLRDQHRAAHRKYVLEHAAPIRTAGAMRDAEGNQCGSIYVFEAASAEDVWAWLRAEPFVAQGVYESIRVVEWAPAFNTLATVDWPK